MGVGVRVGVRVRYRVFSASGVPSAAGISLATGFGAPAVKVAGMSGFGASAVKVAGVSGFDGLKASTKARSTIFNGIIAETQMPMAATTAGSMFARTLTVSRI